MTEVDTERRRMAARERADDDTVMQMAIQKLVVETNEVVEKSAPPNETVQRRSRQGMRERLTTRERDERWRRFREDLNDGEVARKTDDEAARIANAKDEDVEAVDTEADMIVRKRVRRRSLFSKMLGGVLRRGEGDDTASSGVEER